MHNIETLLNQFTTPSSNRSFFLTFEGIEGAGKSTQIEKVRSYLEEKGFRILQLREPGGTHFGERLREAILGSEVPISPISEAYLFASSRAQLLTEKVLPFLEEPNSVVLCDRYIDSSLAYQGLARKLGFEQILDIHTKAPLNQLPHMTFYYRIDLETSLERQRIRNQEKDYFEKNDADFYQMLINGYDKAAELFPERIKIIPSNGGIEEIWQDAKKHLENLVG